MHTYTLAHAACAALLLLPAVARAAGGAPGHEPELRRMAANCNVAMARKVCSVSNGPAASAVTGNALRGPVFIVGAGSVEPAAYAFLQDGGKEMCRRAEAACSADWSGSVCRTARSLWAQ